MNAPEDALVGILGQKFVRRSTSVSDSTLNPGAIQHYSQEHRIPSEMRPVIAQVLAEWVAGEKARAWDEGFKQGGPMHDENYDNPDAHRRNPYRSEP